MIRIEPSKQFHDSIHGLIRVSNLAIRIIDTPEFQRLRQLHQLGTAYYVYQTATHSRFEHSIGTYFLAGKLLESIRRDTLPEEIDACMSNISTLQHYYQRRYVHQPGDRLDPYVCELVKIAGLCHDLGHGPFSHIFDDALLPMIKPTTEPNQYELHETRSGLLVEHIVTRDPFLSKIIQPNEIQFIKDLINPTEEHQGFIYQIISNNLNSIDVDKYDYMARDSYMLGLRNGFNFNRLVEDARVINNIICFPEQIGYEVVSIFQTRYRLHKQVYSHKVVITTQMMICDIVRLLDPIMKIYESIADPEKFCQLTDDYVLSAVKYLHTYRSRYGEETQERIEEAYKIYNRIVTRDLYRLVLTIASDHRLEIDLLDVVGCVENPNVVMTQSKIGFVGGMKTNPVDELYFYKTKNPTKCHKLPKEQISFLLSDKYQEYLYMIILRDKDKKLEEEIKSRWFLFNSE